MKMFELRRQFVHALFGIVVAVLVLTVGRENALVLLTGFLFFGMLVVNLELLAGSRKNIFTVLFRGFERKHVMPGKGALNYIVGVLFLLAFAPSVFFALGILLILAIADAFSTIVGVSAGARKYTLFWNSSKSWDGLITFIVTGFIASFYFLGLETALLYSVVLAVVETVDFGIDDNLLIPITAMLLNIILGGCFLV